MFFFFGQKMLCLILRNVRKMIISCQVIEDLMVDSIFYWIQKLSSFYSKDFTYVAHVKDDLLEIAYNQNFLDSLPRKDIVFIFKTL